jgi:hypothetical protein
MKNLNSFPLDFIVAPNPGMTVMHDYYMTRRGYRWALLDCDYGIDNVIESLRYANLGDDDDLEAARRWRDRHGSPRQRTVRPSLQQGFETATLCKVDMIIAERGDCRLSTEGDHFVISTSADRLLRRHELSIEHTDLKRLKAHWVGYCQQLGES